MKDRTSNRINMLRVTLDYLSKNPAPTAGIPAFTSAKDAVAAKINLIDSLNQVAGSPTKGVTLDTNQLRSKMTVAAFKCSSALSAYASSINNNTLLEKIKFTVRTLNKKKKEQVSRICQNIHDEAHANLAVAGAFGYTAADVTALENAIDSYSQSSPSPRVAIVSRSQAVARVDATVREAINIFKNQMDLIISTLKADHPVFVSGYFLARQIIDLGHTTAKVRGTIKDKNDVPLVGVTFTIKKSGAKEPLAETQTTDVGKFKIASLLPAHYDFTWTFPGYQPITETNVHISAGKELRRKLTMIKT